MLALGRLECEADLAYCLPLGLEGVAVEEVFLFKETTAAGGFGTCGVAVSDGRGLSEGLVSESQWEWRAGPTCFGAHFSR